MLPLNIHLNSDALTGVMLRHVCGARVGLSETTAVGAFLRLTLGPFFPGKRTAALPPLCASKLFADQSS